MCRFSLKNKNVLCSKTETNAILNATIECLRYVITKSNDNVDVCATLIRSQLFPLLGWTFNNDDDDNVGDDDRRDVSTVNESTYKNVYVQVASLIYNWYVKMSPSNVDDIITDAKRTNYSRYLEIFWTDLKTLICDRIVKLIETARCDDLSETSNLNRIDNFVVRCQHCLTSLKHVERGGGEQRTTKRKRQSVKFVAVETQGVIDKSRNPFTGSGGKTDASAASSTSTTSCSTSSSSSVLQTSGTVSNDYERDLNCLVRDVCLCYVDRIRNVGNCCPYVAYRKRMIDHFKTIVIKFDDRQFFSTFYVSLLAHLNVGNVHDRKLIDVHSNLFKLWLYDPDLRSDSCVDLIFLLCKYLEDERDKDTIVNDLITVSVLHLDYNVLSKIDDERLC